MHRRRRARQRLAERRGLHGYRARRVHPVHLPGEGAGPELQPEQTAYSTALSVTMPDLAPPTPNPMTWASVPAAHGPASIRMTATTATDPSGVEYYFQCTAGGGHDSGWQSGAAYMDTGLASSTQYTYQVKARDKSAAQNETAYSIALSATTQSGTPPGAVLGWGLNSKGEVGDGTTIQRRRRCATRGRRQPVSGRRRAVPYAGPRRRRVGLGLGMQLERPARQRHARGQSRCRSESLRCTGSSGLTAGTANPSQWTGNGAVWAWGCNTSGQLGDGTRTNRKAARQGRRPDGRHHRPGRGRRLPHPGAGQQRQRVGLGHK